MEKELIWNLECAEANLQEDIQALGYIQDTCETTEGNDWLLSQHEIKNQLSTLIKSMIYNHENILKAVNEYYANHKKEGVA